ncbi:MAG: ABC transporter permease [Planctomycetota bacterium]|nr:ABC transporter permease [Planctomycetota bacterium]
MQAILRHLRLVRLFWSTSLAAEMEYRLNFVVASINSVGTLAGGIFGLFLFYRTGYRPGGWRWEEALVVMGLFTLLEGFTRTLLTPNLGRIVAHVQTGTLDFVLLKPISSQFWLSMRNFSPWGLPDVALGLGVIAYSAWRLGVAPAAIAAGLVPVALSVVTLYSLWFILGTTTIWFVKTYNVTEVLRGLLEAGMYPLAAYPAGYRIFFTFVVPVAFLTTVPAEIVLGREGQSMLFVAAAVAMGLLAFSIAFWRFALRYYTSASS